MPYRSDWRVATLRIVSSGQAITLRIVHSRELGLIQNGVLNLKHTDGIDTDVDIQTIKGKRLILSNIRSLSL